jgi:Tol biopolymer transport system component/tRNA A-37 threonylcarbamoyl transferase component Bud32
MNSLIGRTLGQYRIIEKIGQGGMATVYKAYQPGLDRYVALKVLPPTHAEQSGFSERFRREAKAIANLHHPNILPVHDFGQEEGHSFIVMRYIEGTRTLKELMETPLSLVQAAGLIEQIAAALDHAHQQGVIHRDMKPSNVLMDGDWALLTDFGLAKMTEASVKLTGSGVGIGTPAYMSPEQGQGVAVDHRTDIYSLGVILFEMLTGQIPHDAETPFAIVLKRITEPLPLPRAINPEIPEAVERVILKALAREPDDRFASAGAMAAAFQQAVSEAIIEEVKVPPPPSSAPPVPAPIPARPALPWKWVTGIGAVAVVVALCVVGLSTALGSRGKPTATPRRIAVVPTATPTATAAIAPTLPPTRTLTPTATDTLPSTPTHTPTPTSTDTPTLAPTHTSPPPTPTPTLTLTPTPSPSPTLTPVPPTPTPSPTPSGGRIVFSSNRDGNGEIYVMYADGSGQTNLTRNPANDWSPCWSPDGTRIAFTSERDGNREIYTMNAVGSGQTRLTNHPGVDDDPVWLPDGTHIAFSSTRGDQWGVYTMNTDGSEVTFLTFEGDWHTPSVSQDGTRITFFSYPPTVDSWYEIYVMNMDGSGKTNLTNNPASKDEYPRWSPDGARIAFQSWRDGNCEIYVMNADGRELTRLTNHPSPDMHPAWSPDGTKIAFTSLRDNNGEIYVMNADGSGLANLTNHPAEDGSPAWTR